MGDEHESGRPLGGIRVIDLTRVMSGPLATVMLADLGAEVIKIEPPGGDLTRLAGGHARNGVTAMFLALNRGKKSVVVDLTTDDGRAAVAELAATADVFVENFRPGVADSMGLDSETLRTRNPRLVYVSINGYGRDGALQGAPAYDTIIQGQTAMIARQSIGRGLVDKVRSFPVDKLSGMFAAQAVLAALYERASTGRGSTIDVPMFDAAMYWLWPDIWAEQAFADGEYTHVADTWRGAGVVAARDGDIVYLAVALKEHHGVLRAIGRPELVDDERFATFPACQRNARERHGIIDAAIAEMSVVEVVERLRANGVAATAVMDTDDVLAEPDLIDDGFFVEWEHEQAGHVRHPRFPVRFDRRRHRTPGSAPALGGHAIEALLDRAVVDDDREPASVAHDPAIEEGREP